VFKLGGHQKWAQEFGLLRASEVRDARAAAREADRAKIPPASIRREARLLQELEAFCVGRDFFPTCAEMEAAGHGSLRLAIKRRGGIHVWAPRVGLPIRPAQDRRPYGVEDVLEDAKRVYAQYGRLPAEATLRRLGYGKLASFLRYRFNDDRRRFIELYLES
jgi:hypothetical protein